MNYIDHNQTNGVLDSLASSSFIDFILQPTTITTPSNILIENIFPNVLDPGIISSDLTTSNSANLPQLALKTSSKCNIYYKDWRKFDRGDVILGYFSFDWGDLLKIDELNVNYSTQMHLDEINMLLDTYVLVKRIDKCKFKFKSKPWITLSLQKSIFVKFKLLARLIN